MLIAEHGDVTKQNTAKLMAHNSIAFNSGELIVDGEAPVNDSLERIPLRRHDEVNAAVIGILNISAERDQRRLNSRLRWRS